MPLDNERSVSLMQAHFRAIHAASDTSGEDFDHTRVLTRLMRHGGLYTLMDSDMMTLRLTPLMKHHPDLEGDPVSVSHFVKSLGSLIASFFQHLKPTNFYVTDSSLISHICFPGLDTSGTGTIRGVTYTKDMPYPSQQAEKDVTSKFIPAAFTFIGQFIDHDLTMNAVNLFDPQTEPIPNTASPFIDLDSVYGPRTKLFNVPKHGSLYNHDGTFKLVENPGGPGGKPFHDLPRDSQTHKAFIGDARNDENQLILQVHLLVMRLHNKLLTEKFTTGSPVDNFKQAHQETIYLWQSMIVDDFLAHVLRDDVRTTLLGELGKPNFGDFVYKPWLNLATNKYEASLPHEFAIAYRMGHSMLKPRYELQPGGPGITLFDNSLAPNGANFDDLRGSQPLVSSHVIDFNFFAGGFFSNTIDSHVTSVVFDLPESTIPDDIKFVGNLIQRNLIRSSQVGLCCGEDLAALYKSHYPDVDELTPEDVEKDPAARDLFIAKDANLKPRSHNGKPLFQTPLFYYILKDADKNGTTRESLGLLGSYLVGEVILGAIAWADITVLNQGKRRADWTPAIPLADPTKVTFLDLVNFVG